MLFSRWLPSPSGRRRHACGKCQIGGKRAELALLHTDLLSTSDVSGALGDAFIRILSFTPPDSLRKEVPLETAF